MRIGDEVISRDGVISVVVGAIYSDRFILDEMRGEILPQGAIPMYQISDFYVRHNLASWKIYGMREE